MRRTVRMLDTSLPLQSREFANFRRGLITAEDVLPLQSRESAYVANCLDVGYFPPPAEQGEVFILQRARPANES